MGLEARRSLKGFHPPSPGVSGRRATRWPDQETEASIGISTKQERDFIDSIMPQCMLDEAIDWIRANLSPEDVFSVNELEELACDNGYCDEKE